MFAVHFFYLSCEPGMLTGEDHLSADLTPLTWAGITSTADLPLCSACVQLCDRGRACGGRRKLAVEARAGPARCCVQGVARRRDKQQGGRACQEQAVSEQARAQLHGGANAGGCRSTYSPTAQAPAWAH